MDFDLEIINEEGDCPNHLFESIMNAMNSMKEATADKIYQKIQRDGESNYSKPQVDRALANALKYGIFEVRNNRYRVRNDILDDEDTIYWKLHEKNEQTPLRIKDNNSEKHFGIKLDPESDNQRFRKIENSEVRECPHCGRVKKLDNKKSKVLKKSEQRQKMQKKKQPQKCTKKGGGVKKNYRTNRKNCKELKDTCVKRKNRNKKSEGIAFSSDTLLNDFWTEMKNDLQEKNSYDSRSTIDPFQASESTDCSPKDNNNFNNQRNTSEFHHSSDVEDNRSSLSLKSDTISDKTSYSSGTEIQCQGRLWDYQENYPCTSREGNNKVMNQYLRSNEVYHDYDKTQTDQHNGRSDWMGHSDEPQGAIIQSKNVLTIEPMDTLAFKSPEQASYIS